MALIRPMPPEETAAAFSAALPDYLDQPRDRAAVEQQYAGPHPRIPSLEELEATARNRLIHDGQQVFMLTLSAAVNSEGVGAATRAGWRFFAGDERGQTVLGRVSAKQPGSWRMTAAYYGERAWAVLQASRQLDALPQVAEADYELRILAIPGLAMEVFWLAARKPGIDLVVAWEPSNLPPRDGQPTVYTMPNFLATIRPKALIALHGR